MTFLVGGLGQARDTLLCAALRGAGLGVRQLPPPSDVGLRRARALGNHGQCSPAHYAVGAVLQAADASGLSRSEFARTHQWVTVGSCGPCRLAAFPLEWAKVLRAEGLSGLGLELVDQLAFTAALGPRRLVRSAGMVVLAALTAGDVLSALERSLRPWVCDPQALDAVLANGVAELAAALEQGEGARATLARVASRARALELDPMRALPRVLLVGEPWTTLTDGDPSDGVVRRLEAVGAEVDVPRVVDWLRMLAWQRSVELQEGPAERETCARAVTGVSALWRLLAGAAGVFEPLESPADLAALATPWYPPLIRGGSAHLEVARALSASQRRAVHLVLSVKPFGCLPSSALSDGVLGPLLRKMPRAPAFAVLEANATGQATVDSRLTLALERATLAALDEFDEARAHRGLSLLQAQQVLSELPITRLDGVRRYACSAAERLVR
ncbi:MAG: hypothetical protein Q8N26_23505 [Myxococcales bacterium]|nr:hypothetical protein [Myxococcales bacterium]